MPLSDVLIYVVCFVSVGLCVATVGGVSAAGPKNKARNWRDKDFTSVFAN